MSEPGSRRGRGRVHDAEGAREAILNAAEEVFAVHGFDGARIDAIAETADYNKSLIFHYYGDKLGLYAEVLKRADRETAELQPQLFKPLFEDEAIATDAHRFKPFLEALVRIMFNYLVEHPRIMRILLWEMAENWQTYAKISSQMDTEDLGQFEKLFQRAWNAGLLRSNFASAVQLAMVVQICQSYLAYLPLYQSLLPGEDVSSDAALARAREYIVAFIVHGMMADPEETK